MNDSNDSVWTIFSILMIIAIILVVWLIIDIILRLLKKSKNKNRQLNQNDFEFINTTGSESNLSFLEGSFNYKKVISLHDLILRFMNEPTWQVGPYAIAEKIHEFDYNIVGLVQTYKLIYNIELLDEIKNISFSKDDLKKLKNFNDNNKIKPKQVNIVANNNSLNQKNIVLIIGCIFSWHYLF